MMSFSTQACGGPKTPSVISICLSNATTPVKKWFSNERGSNLDSSVVYGRPASSPYEITARVVIASRKTEVPSMGPHGCRSGTRLDHCGLSAYQTDSTGKRKAKPSTALSKLVASWGAKLQFLRSIGSRRRLVHVDRPFYSKWRDELSRLVSHHPWWSAVIVAVVVGALASKIIVDKCREGTSLNDVTPNSRAADIQASGDQTNVAHQREGKSKKSRKGKGKEPKSHLPRPVTMESVVDASLRPTRCSLHAISTALKGIHKNLANAIRILKEKVMITPALRRSQAPAAGFSSSVGETMLKSAPKISNRAVKIIKKTASTATSIATRFETVVRALTRHTKIISGASAETASKIFNFSMSPDMARSLLKSHLRGEIVLDGNTVELLRRAAVSKGTFLDRFRWRLVKTCLESLVTLKQFGVWAGYHGVTKVLPFFILHAATVVVKAKLLRIDVNSLLLGKGLYMQLPDRVECFMPGRENFKSTWHYAFWAYIEILCFSLGHILGFYRSILDIATKTVADYVVLLRDYTFLNGGTEVHTASPQTHDNGPGAVNDPSCNSADGKESAKSDDTKCREPPAEDSPCPSECNPDESPVAEPLETTDISKGTTGLSGVLIGCIMGVASRFMPPIVKEAVKTLAITYGITGLVGLIGEAVLLICWRRRKSSRMCARIVAINSYIMDRLDMGCEFLVDRITKLNSVRDEMAKQTAKGARANAKKIALDLLSVFLQPLAEECATYRFCYQSLDLSGCLSCLAHAPLTLNEGFVALVSFIMVQVVTGTFGKVEVGVRVDSYVDEAGVRHHVIAQVTHVQGGAVTVSKLMGYEARDAQGLLTDYSANQRNGGGEESSKKSARLESNRFEVLDDVASVRSSDNNDNGHSDTSSHKNAADVRAEEPGVLTHAVGSNENQDNEIVLMMNVNTLYDNYRQYYAGDSISDMESVTSDAIAVDQHPELGVEQLATDATLKKLRKMTDDYCLDTNGLYIVESDTGTAYLATDSVCTYKRRFLDILFHKGWPWRTVRELRSIYSFLDREVGSKIEPHIALAAIKVESLFMGKEPIVEVQALHAHLAAHGLPSKKKDFIFENIDVMDWPVALTRPCAISSPILFTCVSYLTRKVSRIIKPSIVRTLTKITSLVASAMVYVTSMKEVIDGVAALLLSQLHNEQAPSSPPEVFANIMVADVDESAVPLKSMLGLSILRWQTPVLLNKPATLINNPASVYTAWRTDHMSPAFNERLQPSSSSSISSLTLKNGKKWYATARHCLVSYERSLECSSDFVFSDPEGVMCSNLSMATAKRLRCNVKTLNVGSGVYLPDSISATAMNFGTVLATSLTAYDINGVPYVTRITVVAADTTDPRGLSGSMLVDSAGAAIGVLCSSLNSQTRSSEILDILHWPRRRIFVCILGNVVCSTSKVRNIRVIAPPEISIKTNLSRSHVSPDAPGRENRKPRRSSVVRKPSRENTKEVVGVKEKEKPSCAQDPIDEFELLKQREVKLESWYDDVVGRGDTPCDEGAPETAGDRETTNCANSQGNNPSQYWARLVTATARSLGLIVGGEVKLVVSKTFLYVCDVMRHVVPNFLINLAGRATRYWKLTGEDIEKSKKSADYIHNKMSDVSSTLRADEILNPSEAHTGMLVDGVAAGTIRKAINESARRDTEISTTVFPELHRNIVAKETEAVGQLDTDESETEIVSPFTQRNPSVIDNKTMPGAYDQEIPGLVRITSETTVLGLAKLFHRELKRGKAYPRDVLDFCCMSAVNGAGETILVVKESSKTAIQALAHTIMDRYLTGKECMILATQFLGMRYRDLDRSFPEADVAHIVASGVFQCMLQQQYDCMQQRRMLSASNRTHDNTGKCYTVDATKASLLSKVDCFLIAINALMCGYDTVLILGNPNGTAASETLTTTRMPDRVASRVCDTISLLTQCAISMDSCPTMMDPAAMVEQAGLTALCLYKRTIPTKETVHLLFQKFQAGSLHYTDVIDSGIRTMVVSRNLPRAKQLRKSIYDFSTLCGAYITYPLALTARWLVTTTMKIVEGASAALDSALVAAIAKVTRVFPLSARLFKTEYTDAATSRSAMRADNFSNISVELLTRPRTILAHLFSSVIDAMIVSQISPTPADKGALSATVLMCKVSLDACLWMASWFLANDKHTAEGRMAEIAYNLFWHMAKTGLFVWDCYRIFGGDHLKMTTIVDKIAIIHTLVVRSEAMEKFLSEGGAFFTKLIHKIGKSYVKHAKRNQKSFVRKMFSNSALLCNPAVGVACCIVTAINAAYTLDYAVATSFFASFSIHRSLANLQKTRAEAAKNAVSGWVSFNKLGAAISEAAKGHPSVINAAGSRNLLNVVAGTLIGGVMYNVVKMTLAWYVSKAVYNWFVGVVNSEAVINHAHEVNPKFSDAIKNRGAARKLVARNVSLLSLLTINSVLITNAYYLAGPTAAIIAACLSALTTYHVNQSRPFTRCAYAVMASFVLGVPGVSLLAISASVMEYDSPTVLYTLGLPLAVLASMDTIGPSMQHVVAASMSARRLLGTLETKTESTNKSLVGRAKLVMRKHRGQLTAVAKCKVFADHDKLSSEMCSDVAMTLGGSGTGAREVYAERAELMKAVLSNSVACEAFTQATEMLSSQRYFAEEEDQEDYHSLRAVGVLQGFSATMMHGFERISIEAAHPCGWAITQLGINTLEATAPSGTYMQILSSMRNRSQATKRALLSWQSFIVEHWDVIEHAIVVVVTTLYDLGVYNKWLDADIDPLLFLKAKASTPGLLTRHVTGFRTMKDLHHYLLDVGAQPKPLRKGLAQLYNLFGKVEVLKTKPYKPMYGVHEQYRDPTNSTRIRIIQTVEGLERLRSYKSEIWLNTGLLLSRLVIPLKKGLRVAAEWPLLVASMSKYKWIVTIDIENYDGNQHRGMVHLQGIVRMLLSEDVKSLEEASNHNASVTHRITLNKFGLVTEVMGTMPSGDVNTTDDNSLRSWLIVEMAAKISGLRRHVNGDYGMSGDNIFICCDSMEIIEKLRDVVTSVGWPSTLDGLVDTTSPNSAVIMPEFLGMVGVRHKLTIRTITGQMATITVAAAWRNPDRILPKLVCTAQKLSDRMSKQRCKQKAMLALYTWPLDKNLQGVANNLQVTIYDLIDSSLFKTKNLVKQAQTLPSSIRPEQIEEEMSMEFKGREMPSVDRLHGGWCWWVSKHIGLPGLITDVLSNDIVDCHGTLVQPGPVPSDDNFKTRGKPCNPKNTWKGTEIDSPFKIAVKYNTNCSELSEMLSGHKHIEINVSERIDMSSPLEDGYDCTVQCKCSDEQLLTSRRGENKTHVDKVYGNCAGDRGVLIDTGHKALWTCRDIMRMLKGEHVSMSAHLA